ncbi:hypothetical protein ABH915_000525 [Arthrobacter sp. MW3 TE3886]
MKRGAVPAERRPSHQDTRVRRENGQPSCGGPARRRTAGKSCVSDGPAGTSQSTFPLTETSSTSPAAMTCACLTISTRSPTRRPLQSETVAADARRLDSTVPRAFIELLPLCMCSLPQLRWCGLSICTTVPGPPPSVSPKISGTPGIVQPPCILFLLRRDFRRPIRLPPGPCPTPPGHPPLRAPATGTCRCPDRRRRRAARRSRPRPQVPA